MLRLMAVSSTPLSTMFSDETSSTVVLITVLIVVSIILFPFIFEFCACHITVKIREVKVLRVFLSLDL